MLAVEPASALGEEGLQPSKDFVDIRAMRVGHFFNGDQPLVDVARVRAGEDQRLLGRTQKVLVVLGGGLGAGDVGTDG